MKLGFECGEITQGGHCVVMVACMYASMTLSLENQNNERRTVVFRYCHSRTRHPIYGSCLFERGNY